MRLIAVTLGVLVALVALVALGQDAGITSGFDRVGDPGGREESGTEKSGSGHVLPGGGTVDSLPKDAGEQTAVEPGLTVSPAGDIRPAKPSRPLNDPLFQPVDPIFYGAPSAATSDRRLIPQADATRGEACRESIRLFVSATHTIRRRAQKEISQPTFWQNLNDCCPTDEVNNFTEGQKKFKESCLSKAELGFDQDLSRELEQVIGFFRNKDGTFCTGTRITPSEVLTAAHCFYDLDNGWAKLSSANESRFYFGTGQHFSSEFRIPDPPPNQGGGYRAIKAKNDHLIVTLTSHEEHSNLPALKFSSPQLNEELVLVGYGSEFVGADVTDPAQYLGTHARVGGCYIKALSGGCIHHGCQSTAGFSGAALFRKHSGADLVLVGIHLGTNSGATDDGQCGAGRDLNGNLGFTLPPRLTASVSANN